MLASEGTPPVAAGRHSVTTQGSQIMLKRILGATLMVALLGTASIAADAKPTDPQIAYIAYTAGQIDVGFPGEH
jgi:hypothetical protein